MAELVEHQLDMKGYQLHVIPTKKFKTNVLVVRFLAPLERDTATKRALLPFVLQKGTRQYPSERKLRTRLDELYGADLNIDVSKKGENHLITIRISFVNEKFLPEEDSLMDEVLQLVQQLLFEPDTDGNGFKSEVVEKEKDTLRQKIESIKDQKMSYANMRLIDEMCKDEPYETHVHGYLEDLDSIDGQNLYDTFHNMLKQDHMDVFFLGDVDVDQTKQAMKNALSFDRQPVHKPTIVTETSSRKNYQEVTEMQKIQQGKLHMGFRTNTTFKDSEYFTMQVFNGLFGGFPHSKLFVNVREKHQLAYYAASRFESHKGLLLVFSGIAPEAYGKAKDIIIKQFEEMKKGNFTDTEVEETKRLTIHQLKETFDHPVGIIELMYHQVLADQKRSPGDMFNGVEQVKKEDLISFAEKVDLDTIYFLTSEGDNK
ncbi:Predicted Zn-dependent peptidase [Salinibacillus kushneri]|uniref:Predicted Zn-dependent peptidase n=1 Tax=Salinibacillus kushneri TaxID=237682 RepID=A0A1I0E6B3_9BACI|nr:pitrilysin family protein [Salinibacillus kushneri]SET39779.1 Predicted Zn-dependent peptidase [Salinibacillus kushneri]